MRAEGSEMRAEGRRTKKVPGMGFLGRENDPRPTRGLGILPDTRDLGVLVDTPYGTDQGLPEPTKDA